MSVYSKTSPYYETQQFGPFLDVLTYRIIPKNITDVSFSIVATYNLKPQLLAYDLYADTLLWWVFASRNPNVLTDPLFSFVTGTTIFIPTKETLITVLGL